MSGQEFWDGEYELIRTIDPLIEQVRGEIRISQEA
jgi:hypothetical protein